MSEAKDLKEFLNLLYKSKPSYRKVLLESSSPKVIHLLANCALNILQGQIVLTKQQKNKLSKHKHNLRKLANDKISVKQKKKILQKGGLLPPFLLPLLAPIAGSIFGAVTSKILK